MNHEIIEKNLGLLIIFILIVISIGGLVEIVPLFFQSDLHKPLKGLLPTPALELEGRDIYIREGCHVCHTQMVRPLYAETKRYGAYSVVGEYVYEHPFLWGSKRTGPDLARIGGRYSDDWHRIHLQNPRLVVPASKMPAYPWLKKHLLNDTLTAKKMIALRKLGVPYTDKDIETASKLVKNKTEEDAIVAYLQQLGLAYKKSK
ncbi:MAG TPA: cytochrome-c oxidase, cbb3-type subunit II [Candidatus Azoamicus sp. OHIO2]